MKATVIKMELTLFAINFISSKDDEVQVMYSKSDSIKVMTYDNVHEVIK